MDMGSAQGIDRLPKDQQRQIPISWVVPRCLIGVLSLRQFWHFSYRGINTVGSVGNCHRNCFCVFVFVYFHVWHLGTLALRSLHHYQSLRKCSICWVYGQLRPKLYLYLHVGGYSPIVNRSPQELGLPKGQPPFGLTPLGFPLGLTPHFGTRSTFCPIKPPKQVLECFRDARPANYAL